MSQDRSYSVAARRLTRAPRLGAQTPMSEAAMDAGVGVKVESEDQVEPYDGTYACGFCSESVRGTAALQCSQCSANPVHWACVAGTKYAGQCATCGGETMEAWRRGAGGGAAGPSEMIDLRNVEGEGAGQEGGGGAERRGQQQEEGGARRRRGGKQLGGKASTRGEAGAM